MALPTQSEVLKLSIVNELNHGHDLSIILDKLVAAIEGNACGPNIETEEPQCKTALLRAIECGSISYVEKFVSRTKNCGMTFWVYLNSWFFQAGKPCYYTALSIMEVILHRSFISKESSINTPYT